MPRVITERLGARLGYVFLYGYAYNSAFSQMFVLLSQIS